MRTLWTITSICIMFLVPVGIQAQGTGSSAMDFLNIGVSAKSSAMGGAFSAIADGPVSSFYNPAGLSSIENYQIAGMHTEWYQDLRYEYLGYGMPVSRSGGLGFSFSYLTYGSIEGYSETGVPLGKLEAYDMALNLSFGHRIKGNLSMGLGIKGVSEKLAEVTTKGFAGDFGLQLRHERYIAGLSIMNFGPNLKYGDASSPLPTTVNAGILYKPFGSSLSVITGGTMPFRGEFSFKAGIEYSYNDVFMLRTGYDTEQNYNGNSGISFGAGINVSNHNLDYAYKINDVMGGTHQISFVFKFGEERSAERHREVSYTQAKEVPVQEIYTVTQNDILEQQIQTIPENNKTIQESYTENDISALQDSVIAVENNISVKKELSYQICAARYHNKESAQRHVETLKKFGIDSELYFDGAKEYRVVLDVTKKRSKAEKIKSDFDKKGVFCFIQEL